jgi:hypothetical protein
MNDSLDQKVVTSTAATRVTESEVVSAISSGDGHAAKEQAIRERAYAIWKEEGRPEGYHLHHWLRAEAEINGLTSTFRSLPSPH